MGDGSLLVMAAFVRTGSVRLSQRIVAGVTDLESLRGAEDDRVTVTLLDLTGVGRWSAEYVLLRGFGRRYLLPGDDVGARHNLQERFGLAPSGGYEEVNVLSRRWSPYRGLAYFHLLLGTLAAAGYVKPEVLAEAEATASSYPRGVG